MVIQTPAERGGQQRNCINHESRTKDNGGSINALREVKPRAGKAIGYVAGSGDEADSGAEANEGFPEEKLRIAVGES